VPLSARVPLERGRQIGVFPKKRYLAIIGLYSATKLLKINQDNLHMKFLALKVDFSSLSPDFLGSRRPAQAGVKKWLPLYKVVILPQLSRVRENGCRYM